MTFLPFGSFQDRARRALIIFCATKISPNLRVSRSNDVEPLEKAPRDPGATQAPPLRGIAILRTNFFTAGAVRRSPLLTAGRAPSLAGAIGNGAGVWNQSFADTRADGKE